MLSESRILADFTDFADFGVFCVSKVFRERWVSLVLFQHSRPVFSFVQPNLRDHRNPQLTRMG